MLAFVVITIKSESIISSRVCEYCSYCSYCSYCYYIKDFIFDRC